MKAIVSSLSLLTCCYIQLNEERIQTNLEMDSELVLPVMAESPITNTTTTSNNTNNLSSSSDPSDPSDPSLSCSRCLPLKTGVDVLAWTLSTLRQTIHESDQVLRSTRGDRVETMNTSELLHRYRDLQVDVVYHLNPQSRSASNRLVVIKSLIHGWGLFANSSFKAGEMVIEFAGEVISQSVANEREIMYVQNTKSIVINSQL